MLKTKLSVEIEFNSTKINQSLYKMDMTDRNSIV